MLKKFAGKLVAVAPLAAAVPAFAQTGPDFSSLTGGIVLTGVVTAVLAVALVKIAPLVAIWGSKVIMGMVKR